MPKIENPESWTFEESPCETCQLVSQCRAQQLACDAFKSFVTYGGRRWRAEPRVPNAELYAKIYRAVEREAA